MAYDTLSAEIDRITSSPYPSQLRTLRDIVATQTSPAEIAQWAASKPCLIEPLVACLLDGLQQWSYVLEILGSFARERRVRDALLRREPTLLHTCVANAVKGESSDGKGKARWRAVAVSLLASPLPETVALPAEAQGLFVGLMEEAAKKPCARTIEPVYLLLSGTGTLLLGVLSTETLVKFEEHLLNILRSGAGAPDQCISLYCLSIMNVVCSSLNPEFRLTASSYTSSDFLQSTPTSSRWKAEAMQQFFTGSKAQRSMQLIVLVVLWAASKSSTDAASEKIKALVLANEVILAIPVDLRKNWCTANTITVRKLQEKLVAEGQDETVKTLALRFLGKLCELNSLPHPVLESLEMTFLEPRCVQIAHTLCASVDDTELFSSVLARAPMSLLLQNAVNYAIRAESSELASGLCAVTRSIRDSVSIIEEQKITGHEIRATLNDAAFSQSLSTLRDMVQRPVDQHEDFQASGWCRKALHRMRSTLAHQISDLLLRACHSPSMSPGSMTLLLSLHASSARGDLQCAHDRPVIRDEIEFGGLDESTKDVEDWREALQTHFKARALVEQDAVTRLFAKACASLEARCENVEQPLRAEREKRQAAEEHNADLTRAFAEMEAKNVDMTIQLRDLEEEKEQRAQDVEHRREENAQLLDRVSILERRLREAQADGERQLAELQRAKQTSELDTASAIAKKQEEIDDLQDALEESNRDAAAQEQELSALRSDLHDARSGRESVEEDLHATNAQITELKESLNALKQTNEALQTANSGLQSDLNTANGNLTTTTSELSALQTQLQNAHTELSDLRATFQREITDLRTSYTQQLDSATESSRQLQSSNDFLSARIEALQKEHAITTSDLETRNAKATDLRKRIEKLQDKCREKDYQIAEAEAMRANLMAAMGISKPLSGNAKLPVREKGSEEMQTQTQEEFDMSTMLDLSPEQEANNSSLLAPPQDQEIEDYLPERTPKRPRSQLQSLRKSKPAFPTLAKSTYNRASTGGQHHNQLQKTSSQVQTRRQTLGIVSGNSVSNRKQGPPVTFKSPLATASPKTATAGKEDAGDGMGEDESTFEGSEIFSGTQGARMLEEDFGGRGGRGREAFDGGTMME